MFLLLVLLLFMGCVETALPSPANQSNLPFSVQMKIRDMVGISMQELATISEINAYRKAAGLSSLKPDSILSEIARNYSKKMAEKGFFSHMDPYTKEYADARLREAHYVFFSYGENLANIQWECDSPLIPKKVVELWNTSKGHREIMLSPEYDRVGVGIFCENNDIYITALFTKTIYNVSFYLQPDYLKVFYLSSLDFDDGMFEVTITGKSCMVNATIGGRGLRGETIKLLTHLTRLDTIQIEVDRNCPVVLSLKAINEFLSE